MFVTRFCRIVAIRSAERIVNQLTADKLERQEAETRQERAGGEGQWKWMKAREP